MARGSTGKWVQRAASTGGGRTYRGQVPANWYALLVLIVILGIASVVYARYEYRHPATASAAPPTVGTTWYAGLAFDVCGSSLPSLPASTNASKVGLHTTGNGVVVIAPTKASEAGANATLGAFVDGYSGLSLTTTSLHYPGKATYHNGDKCPAGTPDAGKQGQTQVRYWPNLTAKHSEAVTGDPNKLKLGQSSYVTIAFVPKGATINKSSSVELAVLKAVSGSSTSSSTTTTVPSSTTTTVPPTTTPTT